MDTIKNTSTNSCMQNVSSCVSLSSPSKAFFKSKISFKQKFMNKRLLDKFSFTGYFLYTTNQFAFDVSLARLASYPKHCDLVISQDDVKAESKTELLSKVRKRIYQGLPVATLLSADRSNELDPFEYPITLDVPAFSFTNVYKKRRFSKNPQIITYIDGPFYANSSLSIEEQKKHLKEQIYECIMERQKLTDNEFRHLNNLDTGRNKDDN